MADDDIDNVGVAALLMQVCCSVAFSETLFGFQFFTQSLWLSHSYFHSVFFFFRFPFLHCSWLFFLLSDKMYTLKNGKWCVYILFSSSTTPKQKLHEVLAVYSGGTCSTIYTVVMSLDQDTSVCSLSYISFFLRLHSLIS